MSPVRDPRGRVVVVTGGGSGIGRATGVAFARRGSRVVFADVNATRADDAARAAIAVGAEAIGVECDVALDDDVLALRAATDAAFGPADVVMSNVGVLSIGKPEHIPVSEWARVVNINLMSAVRMVHTFLPGLLERGHGHVVITASTAGLATYSDDRLPYSTTKAALVSLAEGLALSVRPRGIGVTCLCPGPVATNIVEQVTVSGDPVPIRPPALAVLTPDAVGEMVVEAVAEDRFLLLTHPEFRAELVRRAEDPEGYLADQISRNGTEAGNLP